MERVLSGGQLRVCWKTALQKILSGHVKDGDTVVIDVDDDGQTKVLRGDQRQLLPQLLLSIPGNARDVLNNVQAGSVLSTYIWLQCPVSS